MNSPVQIALSPPLRERWQALDGLRGLAAIVVMFSHTGFAFNLLKETGQIGRITEPILFGLLTPGGMAVQILFVLCGFLMASLYPQIKSRTYFLQKRYSRIFPVYTAVVTYAMITQTTTYRLSPLANITILLFVLTVWHVVWHAIATFDRRGLVRLGIFLLLILLQTTVIIFDVTIGARFIKDSGLQMPLGSQGVVMYLNNIVLATPFLRYIGRYQPLYWSLGLEVMFYVVYALGIGSQVQRLGRLKIWQGALVIIGCIVILFSIDSGFRTTLELVNLSFNRSSGFLVGIVLGIAYAQKNILHRVLERISQYRLPMIVGSLLVITTLYMERTVPHLASYEGMMWYWLMASSMIGITLYFSLLPHTLAYRVFSNRFLMYWGMISYSAYLLHEHMLPLINQFTSNNTLSDSILKNLSQLLFTFVAASISYYLVERPYFIWRIPETAVHGATARFHSLLRINVSTVTKAAFGVALVLLFVSGIFQASLSPRMRGYYLPLSDKWSLFPTTTEKILPNAEHTFKFTSPDDFLASIAIDLHYFGENEKYRKDPHAAQFIVQVYGPDSDRPLVTSDRLALDIAGQPYYPIGIPLQEHSRDKTYTVRIAVRNGHADDYVFIRPTRHNLIAIYQYPLAKIKTPIGALSHIVNRITLGLSHTNAFIVIIAFATIVVILNIGRKKNDQRGSQKV